MKLKLFKLLKSVLFIALLIILNRFILDNTIMKYWGAPTSDKTIIIFICYSLAFVAILLLFAFWSGYNHSKEILIAAILYISIPIIKIISFRLKSYEAVSSLGKTSIFDMLSLLWSPINSGIGIIFIYILGRPSGIPIYEFLSMYFPIIMLVLFVITYFLASKISLSKKLKDKPALN